MSKITLTLASALAVALGIGGCATTQAEDPVKKTLLESFKARGIAGLDRLDQNETQRLCSQYPTSADVPKSVAEGVQKREMAAIKYPADGKYLGDWKSGEKIAQGGRGMTWRDKPDTVNGANCYACHQLRKQELSFGNIGPTLYHYGRVRGNSEETLKYTWGKIWNSHAYQACSNMPRFGAAGILTEKQIKDVMALLLDPLSPVNE
ncbi:MAG: sulfur oxidation c-type cytochrome SoxX [Burkholderiales bacterium]|nr:MAG: sulfur oxidation c-type cytochrome SoxX [Burkholderiales bacterium]